MNQLLVIFIAIISSYACVSQNNTSSDGKLRVISHNVYYGFTKVPERKQDWLIWMNTQQPDVVSLQELNEYTPQQLASDAAYWGHAYSALLKETGFPTGLTSRYPIEDIHRYLEGFHHGLMRAKIKGVYFYIIHLHPSNWEFRHREIDLILKNISELPAGSQVILAGDFNTFSPDDRIYYGHGRLEKFFTKLDSMHQANNLNQGKLDYTAIQKITEAGLIDLELSRRSKDYHFTGSFPGLVKQEGDHGDLRRLDYIFISENLETKVQRIEILADDTVQYLSDHLPVMADFEE